QQIIDQGLVYQVTGDIRHAHRAGEILMAYARRYLDYPLHDNQGKPGRGGRVASQSLTEASWLIEMAQGADLVWATLTETERQTIAEKVFRPALEQVILPHPLGIHNIQCRHNSAIGLVGFLLGDRQLIAKAIDDPRIGFRQQIEKGVLADGMWCEGASGYHFFTIGGLWQLAEAARNCGIDLYSPKFQSMFDGPLALAMPDFVLPNFNDSGTVPLQNQDEYYDLAYARFHNPAYLPLLAGTERHSRLALLYGVPQLPSANSAVASTSHNSTASGYAILQRGQGKAATWLCLKYGPHGGGHGHPDKNTFVLYARGQILAPDAGTHAYGSPLHRDWDKTTLAHNTLVVDGESQAPATGKCLAFGSVQDVDYCITEAGPIYKGVTFTRTAALLTSNLLVFVDQVRADAPHTFDLTYHQIGQWEKPASSGSAFAMSAPGYNHLSQSSLRSLGDDGLTLKTKLGSDCSPAIILAGNSSSEIISGYGILKTTEDLVPVLIQRQRAQQSTFVWAVALDGAPVTLRTAPVNDASDKALPSAEAVRVEVATPARNWAFLVNPQGKSVSAPLANGAFWRSEAPFVLR
ncbi:MAG TPA: heparinase II/III family protein, partial [Bacillota bacterium]|nr:heparinase II/III family protein [Bacillota bacterium]